MSQSSWYAAIVMRINGKNKPRAIICTHQNTPTKIRRSTRIELCIEDSQGFTFSALFIFEKMNGLQHRNNPECDTVEVQKDTSVQERKRISLGTIQSGSQNDRNPNAPNYEALHQQRTQHCEGESWIAALKPHTSMCKIRGTFQETRIRSSKLSDRNQS